MFEKLRAFFERDVAITDEQFEFIKTLFVPKKVNKGEFLLREGEMSKYSVFVASGCLRTYTIEIAEKSTFSNFRLKIGGRETSALGGMFLLSVLLRLLKILKFFLQKSIPFKN